MMSRSPSSPPFRSLRELKRFQASVLAVGVAEREARAALAAQQVRAVTRLADELVQCGIAEASRDAERRRAAAREAHLRAAIEEERAAWCAVAEGIARACAAAGPLPTPLVPGDHAVTGAEAEIRALEPVALVSSGSAPHVRRRASLAAGPRRETAVGAGPSAVGPRPAYQAPNPFAALIARAEPATTPAIASGKALTAAPKATSSVTAAAVAARLDATLDRHSALAARGASVVERTARRIAQQRLQRARERSAVVRLASLPPHLSA
jgi:hypothetical protein